MTRKYLLLLSLFISIPTIFAQEKIRNLIELQRTVTHTKKDPPTIKIILMALGVIALIMLFRGLTKKHLQRKYKEEASDYRAHRKKIRSLEAVLGGEEKFKSSKKHWLFR